MPGTAAENALFIQAEAQQFEAAPFQVSEMGLCCFEARSSLTCALTDYPTASPDLSLHVHLPTDLVWLAGTGPETCLQLLRRLAPLGVSRGVLHPPATGSPTELMDDFVESWIAAGHDPADLLLENHRDLTAPALLDLLDRHPVSVCLDVAHMLTYEQLFLLSALDPSRVRLLHWSAPGPVPGKDAHLPLTDLSPIERRTAREAAVRFADALPLIEVFSWVGIVASLPVLTALYDCS